MVITTSTKHPTAVDCQRDEFLAMWSDPRPDQPADEADDATLAFHSDLDRLLAAARAEAVAPVMDVLRQLVEAMHTCDGADGQGGCSRVATRGLFGDSFRLACDEHGDDMGPITYEPQLRAALALLAADQADAKAGTP